MKVVVRPATAADIDRLVELYAAVADEGRWLGGEGPVDTDDHRRRWEARLASGDGVPLVAEADGVVVGQVNVDLTPYGVASLGMLVDRGWRRRGVGSALVRAAIDAARAHGCHKVSLQVWPHNEAALALYRRSRLRGGGPPPPPLPAPQRGAVGRGGDGARARRSRCQRRDSRLSTIVATTDSTIEVAIGT